VSQSPDWTTLSLDDDTSYVIEELELFKIYYVSVSAGTQLEGYGPFSDPAEIQIGEILLATISTCTYIRVIPYQINQEFRVTSQILMKLGIFVVSMGLITHKNFLAPYAS